MRPKKTKECPKCLEIVPQDTRRCDCGCVLADAVVRRKVCRDCGCSEVPGTDVTQGVCESCYRKGWRRSHPEEISKYKNWTPEDHLSYLKGFLRSGSKI